MSIVTYVDAGMTVSVFYSPVPGRENSDGGP
jgi:hypothetical protein